MEKKIDEEKDYDILFDYIKKNGENRVFLVGGRSVEKQRINKLLVDYGINVVRFTDFEVNPTYESVKKGVASFSKSETKVILAIGGGSAIDVAKCIKLYKEKVDITSCSDEVKLIVMPTTAGSGSEATKYAVIYKNGVKQSINDIRCIPDCVIFDPTTLNTLPLYQKKCTMLDALSHCIESFWSVNSTDISREYSKEAIKYILKYKDEYLSGKEEVNEYMLKASNMAGKAINITQTTGGHALSYKLTTMYGVPHGYATALVNTKLWKWMINNTEKCVDKRGECYLNDILMELAVLFGGKNQLEGVKKYQELVNDLQLPEIENAKKNDISVLKKSVNLTRLANNPVELDECAIERLYNDILIKN